MSSVNFQTKAVMELARQLKYRDDSDPDVGMGYSWSHYVLRAALQLELGNTAYDHDAAVTHLTLEHIKGQK